ncbi:MAG: glycosyltransferase family 1 protein [Candidatus Andersenbacteria bacterium]
MNIVFDVSDLSTNRADGTTRYTYELARRLPKLDPSINWTYAAPFDGANRIAEVTAGQPSVKTSLTPWPRFWTQLRFPFDLARAKPDVLLMPIQQLPLLRPRETKTVAVVHDLAFHYFPQQFTYKNWALLHLFTAHAVREADEIIAVSHSTAKDIAHYYGRTNNVHVIHHGVDHTQFRLPSAEEKVATWQTLRQEYSQLQPEYLLFVGQIQPRKNLVRLIEAFERLGNDFPNQLVIAGGHGWLQEDIKKRIQASPIKNRIIELGRVPDELLRALYWNAAAFVLPSLYEGFGMPILEAMASGCPVVTSNVSSLPEIAGEAAVLINPQNPTSIAAGIKAALDNQLNLRVEGIGQARKFSWDQTAQQTLAILKAANQ